MVTLGEFCVWLSKHCDEPVAPETELWFELGIGGDDFDLDLLEHIRRQFQLQLGNGADLRNRIPSEWDLGLIGGLWPRKLRSYTVADLFGQLAPSTSGTMIWR